MIIRVLLALHKPTLQGRIRTLLRRPDVLIKGVKSREALWGAVSGESYDVFIVSQAMLPKPAADLLRVVGDLPEAPEVVVLTRREDSEEQARLLADGVGAVLNLSLSNATLGEALGALLDRRIERASRLGDARPVERQRPSLSQFVSSSPAMQTFLRFVRRVVASDTSLLITGETGVGKEWLARAIHYESPRASGPFVAVNCGALPESLLESELFGHEEGSFTGATRSRRGLFELAHQGTIFLDEIGEMPLHLQVKLLRVLQSREVLRLGGERVIPLDVRIMAATNRALEAELEQGQFRQDLYYRLSVINLVVPPLRDRKEDIPALIESYIEHFRGQFPQVVEGFDESALRACCEYRWPGNVRELINVIERALLICDNERIGLADLPEGIGRPAGANSHLRSGASNWPELSPEQLALPLKELRRQLVDQLEQSYFEALLRDTHGHIGETAQRAGIDPRSLYNIMKRLGLRKEDFKESSE